MTKLSFLPVNNSPSSSDYLVSVQNPSGTTADVNVPISKLFANIPTGAITIGTPYTSTSNISWTSSTSPTTLAPTMTFTASGTQRYRVILYARDCYQNAGTNCFSNITLWDGAVGSGISVAQYQKGSVGVGNSVPCIIIGEWVPTAGSHTINVSSTDSVAGGTIVIEAGAGFPMFLKVELVP